MVFGAEWVSSAIDDLSIGLVRKSERAARESCDESDKTIVV